MTRLQLAAFHPDDATPLYEILRDRDAMRYTYSAPSLEACSKRLSGWEQHRQGAGFAPWVVRVGEPGRIVGWGGLGVDPDDPAWGPEVIYALHPDAWGKGYASELVEHSLQLAFSTLKLPHVDAFAHPDNAASIAVLRKCGFSPVGYEPSLHRNRYRNHGPQLP